MTFLDERLVALDVHDERVVAVLDPACHFGHPIGTRRMERRGQLDGRTDRFRVVGDLLAVGRDDDAIEEGERLHALPDPLHEGPAGNDMERLARESSRP